MNAFSVLTREELAELLQSQLERFCVANFGLEYEEIAKIIYPSPRYKTFAITKKNGDARFIHAPVLELRNVQKKLLAHLETICKLPRSCVHGFVRGRSIVTNALEHSAVRTSFVLNIDLEDFFPSISFKRVRGLFMAKPFEYSFQLATVLAQLTCYQGRLPQGAPTSPFIANLICRKLDTQLMELARRCGARYSRYCDDITFSFRTKRSKSLPLEICRFDEADISLGKELKEIIEANGFTINNRKVRISGRSKRMEVTGLTINQFPNVRRQYIDEIRGALHAWSVHGYDGANHAWQDRVYSRSSRTDDVPPLHRVLWGKLLYLKSVRSSDDVLYSRLAEKYNALVEATHDKDEKWKLLPVLPVLRTDNEVEAAVFVVECIADHPTNGALLSNGTAFAVSGRRLVTCDHVLRHEGDGFPNVDEPYIHKVPGSTVLIRHPESGGEWGVRVVANDRYRDVAVLEFLDAPPKFLRYLSTLNSAPRIHTAIQVMGFPNWSVAKKKCTRTPGRIDNIFPKNATNRFEVSCWIRAGNSGGPVVDENFRLVGVAQEGAQQDNGSNLCLSVDELEKYIAGIP